MDNPSTLVVSDESDTGIPDTQRWVLIESGSNQEFIFQSTRRRFQVGASAVLRDLETWVVEAVAGVEAEIVVCTSGKALLLVDDPDVGRRIVRTVTKRALREAPGLDVWGYVEEEPPNEPPMTRLPQLHADHAAARWGRPSPKQRFPMQPYLETCRITGLPATTTVKEPRSTEAKRAGASKVKRESFPASGTAAAVFARATSAHHDLRTKYGNAVLTDLSADIVNAGWVAVVHADGNGVGDIIKKIASTTELATFSKSLQSATEAAFLSAVKTVPGRSDWLVPLIIGGDDVTFVCDGRVALQVVSAYLQAFERETAAPPLGDAAARATGCRYLTASAGISFVKPHFPFHAAYRLAEELADVAKSVKHLAPGRSAYDFHALHDSSAKPLADIRSDAGEVAGWWAGPFLPATATTAATTAGWEADHAEERLLSAVAALQGDRDDRPLSGSALHDLRSALLGSAAELSRTRVRVTVASRHPEATKEFLDQQSFTDGQHTVSRLVAVIDAADMAAGVLAGERGGPSPLAHAGTTEGGRP